LSTNTGTGTVSPDIQPANSKFLKHVFYFFNIIERENARLKEARTCKVCMDNEVGTSKVLEESIIIKIQTNRSGYELS
jgi:hypothetical protein